MDQNGLGMFGIFLTFGFLLTFLLFLWICSLNPAVLSKAASEMCWML